MPLQEIKLLKNKLIKKLYSFENNLYAYRNLYLIARFIFNFFVTTQIESELDVLFLCDTEIKIKKNAAGQLKFSVSTEIKLR